jgi:hypothetical protein
VLLTTDKVASCRLKSTRYAEPMVYESALFAWKLFSYLLVPKPIGSTRLRTLYPAFPPFSIRSSGPSHLSALAYPKSASTLQKSRLGDATRSCVECDANDTGPLPDSAAHESGGHHLLVCSPV